MNAVDTNLLVYAVSSDEKIKGPQAMDFLDRLSAADTVLLWQVACEFGAVLAKLESRGLASGKVQEALGAVRDRFPLVLPTPHVLDIGLHIHQDQGVSYWDAMLLAACVDAGVDRLYTEDAPGTPIVDGVEIVNPFLTSA